jgi:hypothetical protein
MGPLHVLTRKVAVSEMQKTGNSLITLTVDIVSAHVSTTASQSQIFPA